jgi:hypothetical protein
VIIPSYLYPPSHSIFHPHSLAIVLFPPYGQNKGLYNHTMASSTTSSTASTNTVVSSLLALTTPFVPPAPSCTRIFTTTSAVSSYFIGYNLTTTTLTVVYSDPSNARFTQCQPRGWDQIVPESRFHFSPAVCPGQWTAYALKDDDVDRETPSLARRATTAYCCAR